MLQYIYTIGTIMATINVNVDMKKIKELINMLLRQIILTETFN